MAAGSAETPAATAAPAAALLRHLSPTDPSEPSAKRLCTAVVEEEMEEDKNERKGEAPAVSPPKEDDAPDGGEVVSGELAADLAGHEYESLQLTADSMQTLSVAKVYRDHKSTVNGLDFTSLGRYLVTSGNDDSVFVYDCDSSERRKHLRSEKYGVSQIRFLHNDHDSAIAVSRGHSSHIVKNWDFQVNKYMRLFKSHTGPVTSVDPHPYEDAFLSGSEDQTVLMWDIRTEKPTAQIKGSGNCLATYDRQGLVFATAMGMPRVHLFDTRNYQKGEFVSFDLQVYCGPEADAIAHHVLFSPDGKQLLVRTQNNLLLLDAFDGSLVCQYPVGNDAMRHVKAPEGPPPVPSFTPDSAFVMSGVPGGDVCVWEVGRPVLAHRLRGHTQLPTFVRCSPTHALFVTVAETVAWWIPDPKPKHSDDK